MSIVSGRVITRMGRYRAFPIIGHRADDDRARLLSRLDVGTSGAARRAVTARARPRPRVGHAGARARRPERRRLLAARHSHLRRHHVPRDRRVARHRRVRRDLHHALSPPSCAARFSGTLGRRGQPRHAAHRRAGRAAAALPRAASTSTPTCTRCAPCSCSPRASPRSASRSACSCRSARCARPPPPAPASTTASPRPARPTRSPRSSARSRAPRAAELRQRFSHAHRRARRSRAEPGRHLGARAHRRARIRSARERWPRRTAWRPSASPRSCDELAERGLIAGEEPPRRSPTQGALHRAAVSARRELLLEALADDCAGRDPGRRAAAPARARAVRGAAHRRGARGQRLALAGAARRQPPPLARARLYALRARRLDVRSRCSRWPGASASSLTSSRAFFSRQALPRAAPLRRLPRTPSAGSRLREPPNAIIDESRAAGRLARGAAAHLVVPRLHNRLAPHQAV